MIRQHFYPKAYFRHRSLSKGNVKAQSILQYEKGQNSQNQKIKQVQCNRIRFRRKKSTCKQSLQFPSNDTQQHEEQPSSSSPFFPQQTLHSQGQQSIHQHPPKTPPLNLHSFLQHSQASSQLSSTQPHQVTTILRQIHNRPSTYESQQQQNRKPSHPLFQQQYDNDIKGLFVKSDRKEIVKAKRSSYRVLGEGQGKHDFVNNYSENFFVDGDWVRDKAMNKNNTKRKTSTSSSRRLSSADTSYRCYRNNKSIHNPSKKKPNPTPSQMTINPSTLSPTQPPIHPRTLILSQRPSQHPAPTFQRLTQNLINLNLSKAIKYRQSGMQEKLKRRQSQVGSKENVERRVYDLEQKVRGWEIVVEDDGGFA